MQSAPAIESAHQRQKFRVGRFTVIFFDQIVSAGPAKYEYMVIAVDDSHHTRLYVTAEVNPLAKRFGGGSHFLGVFDGASHINHGSADDWADGEVFRARAVQLIREKSVADMKTFSTPMPNCSSTNCATDRHGPRLDRRHRELLPQHGGLVCGKRAVAGRRRTISVVSRTTRFCAPQSL